MAGDRVTCLQHRTAACEGIDIIADCVLYLSPFLEGSKDAGKLDGDN